MVTGFGNARDISRDTHNQAYSAPIDPFSYLMFEFQINRLEYLHPKQILLCGPSGP